MTVFKIQKFVKKKIDEKEYIMAGIKGKVPAKKMKAIKNALNRAVFVALEDEEKA